MCANQRLRITGGTGTFGNAILARFQDTDIEEMRIFRHDEKKQDDMRRAMRNPKIRFCAGNVRDYDSILSAMQDVDYVVHAGALKQVPSCEFFPLEAMRANTLGAENVMNAAFAYGVKNMVVLSTDKAVYPISAMGMSKALMETLMIAKARMYSNSRTTFCGTR